VVELIEIHNTFVQTCDACTSNWDLKAIHVSPIGDRTETIFVLCGGCRYELKKKLGEEVV
jgi:hypothetical protein